MWFIGKLSRNKRGAGSIVRAVFMLLILLTGFTFYFLNVDVTEDYNKVLQEMRQLDLKRNKENIEFISVSTTSGNKLNITVKNTGSYLAHLIWLGIFNETANTQEYHKINFYVNPAETMTNIRNETITISEVQGLVIQLVTELGNTFSYPPSEEYTYNFVDKTCDLHSPSEKGNHSLFSAQQAGPDGICDTLTEENTGGASGTSTEYSDSQNLVTYKDYGSDSYGKSVNCHKDTWVSDDRYFYFTSTDLGGNLEVQLIYETTITKSEVIWICTLSEDRWEDQANDIQLDIYDYDNSSWVKIITIPYSTEDTQHTYNITSSASEFMSSGGQMKIRYHGTGTEPGKKVYLDHVYLKVGYQEPNYELDLEVQWTTADYDETNEYLSIYAGTIDGEDILVDVWNGTAWINVFTVLSSGWNSADVSSYLVSSNFTIRFRGGTETGDTTQDSWEIDATFLYVWT